MLDAWHWYHSGGTTADILAAGKSRIVHIHVSDAKPAPPEEVRDNQRLMPGEGVIDLIGFFQALRKSATWTASVPSRSGASLPTCRPKTARDWASRRRWRS